MTTKWAIYGPQTNQLSGRIFTHNLGNSPIVTRQDSNHWSMNRRSNNTTTPHLPAIRYVLPKPILWGCRDSEYIWCILFLCFCQRLAGRGVLFSGRPCLWWYSRSSPFTSHWWEFHQIYYLGALRDRYELIWFTGQKVKGRGHCKTKYHQERHFRNSEGYVFKALCTDNLSGKGIPVSGLPSSIISCRAHFINLLIRDAFYIWFRFAGYPAIFDIQFRFWWQATG